MLLLLCRLLTCAALVCGRCFGSVDYWKYPYEVEDETNDFDIDDEQESVEQGSEDDEENDFETDDFA